MEKYGVSYPQEDKKEVRCPKCGSKARNSNPPICPRCGSEPFENKEQRNEQKRRI